MNSAFSLIELLVVVAIMGILAALAVPSLQSLGSAGTVPQSANQIAGILEFARNEAMTRQTYVWVGFDNFVNSDNNGELKAAAFASDDGTVNGNRFQISRVVKMRGVKLVDFSKLKPETKSLMTGLTSTSVADLDANSSLKVGPDTFKQVITFTPRGQALVVFQPNADDGFERTIDVSVRELRGTKELEEGNDAAVLTSGSSGRIEVVQLR